jgi:hypothetical protein
MKNHTPTPWTLSREDDDGNQDPTTYVYIDIDGPEKEWAHFAQIVVRMDHENIDYKEGLGNAALVIRAVNSHDDLVKALEAMIELCENASLDAFKNGVTDPTGSVDQGDVYAGEFIQQSREALAKAKGAGVISETTPRSHI